MALVQWDESLATGIESIDRQHKELFRYFNAMQDKLAAGRDENALRDALDSSRNYIKYHFTQEELFMERFGYEDILHHKAMHKEFVDMVDKVESDSSMSSAERINQLRTFLFNWIVVHIQNMDTKLGKFLKDLGVE